MTPANTVFSLSSHLAVKVVNRPPYFVCFAFPIEVPGYLDPGGRGIGVLSHFVIKLSHLVITDHRTL